MNTVRKILIGIFIAAPDGPRRGGGPLFTARYASALVWKISWLYFKIALSMNQREPRKMNAF